jgi:hypothetical protein
MEWWISPKAKDAIPIEIVSSTDIEHESQSISVMLLI